MSDAELIARPLEGCVEWAFVTLALHIKGICSTKVTRIPALLWFPGAWWVSCQPSQLSDVKVKPPFAALVKEREELHDRITAMETGDWSEVRLVRFENGQFDLTAGPIPAIAEYLAQMMEDGKGEYFNFMEMQINHKSAGPMVLSLQRKNGKTPNELRNSAGTS